MGWHGPARIRGRLFELAAGVRVASRALAAHGNPHGDLDGVANGDTNAYVNVDCATDFHGNLVAFPLGHPDSDRHAHDYDDSFAYSHSHGNSRTD
jgi:hypothetical protein